MPTPTTPLLEVDARLKAIHRLSDEYWDRLAPAHREQYALVRPLPEAAYSVDVAIKRLEAFLAGQDAQLQTVGGGLEMEPDFQRGHVWSQDQRSRYVESVLRGQAPTRLLFNSPNYVGSHGSVGGDLPRNVMQCVDGLQRTAALIGYAQGHVKAFGRTAADFESGPFGAGRLRVQFVVYQFEFRNDLLQFYLDINGGGVVHTQEELDRVRALMSAPKTPGSSDKDGRPDVADVDLCFQQPPLAEQGGRERVRG